ncbi:MAG: hypothetical protein ACK5RY_21610 [Dolichospermum sp.]|nr:hypothetical protein [Anabaena sp. 49628_E55]
MHQILLKTRRKTSSSSVSSTPAKTIMGLLLTKKIFSAPTCLPKDSQSPFSIHCSSVKLVGEVSVARSSPS